jgi:hypothetical protein
MEETMPGDDLTTVARTTPRGWAVVLISMAAAAQRVRGSKDDGGPLTPSATPSLRERPVPQASRNATAARGTFVAIAILVVTLGGCATTTSIPPGGQQVHVVATATDVHLDPAAIHAGDVYLVLDLAPDASGSPQSVDLVYRSTGVRGPLTDDDLATLMQNPIEQGLTYEALNVSCCGNVVKVALTAGRYAFLLAPGSRPGGLPSAMAVLRVVP